MSIPLSTKEEIIYSQTYSAFFIVSKYYLTNKRFISINSINFLGILTFGEKEVSYPLKNIASVELSTNMHWFRVIIGFLLFLISIALTDENFYFGITLVLLAGAVLLSCFNTTMKITNTAGQYIGLELSIMDKNNLKELVYELNSTIEDID
jgi:hypothetical protein